MSSKDSKIPAISIKNLKKSYGDLKAVNDISFEIKQGEFFALLGQNGAGKSTTINIITGLSNKSKGQVEIFGHDVEQDYKLARRCIGFVPQEFNMDKFEVVKKFLDFNAGYFGLSGEEKKIRVHYVLNELGLEDKKDAKILMLSGGMKRRLLIARALLHDPKILILDEPTAGVDVESRRSIWTTMQKLNRQGKTILLTTHYLEEAQELANNIAILHKGNIIANDSKKNIMDQFGKDLVTLHFAKTKKIVPKELQKFNAQLDDSGYSLHFVFDRSKNSSEVLMKIFSKVNPASFEVQKAKLEDIFVELTNGKRGKSK